ncbi:MAG: TonB-dependent receptor domain-containing protein [Vicinamibacterales bacterium]
MKTPRRANLLVAMFLALVLPAAAAGQTAHAELSGTVLDAQGAVLPGATVTARHVETGAVRTVVTLENGTFRMPALPVGNYTVQIELSGFAKTTLENVVLAVGQVADLQFKLQLASVSESVTVTGESPMVETKKSDISGRIDAKQIEALPSVNRDWLMLVSLVPGARGNLGSVVSGASGSDMAKYQVDGVDVTNQCCGGTYMSYSQENLAEFQVLTNRFDAEYGRVGGTVINAVTKSGTNQFRGSFFGYFRNDALDSRNALMDELKQTKREFNQRQMGVTFGGPVVRDRMHFFGTFEQHLREQDVIPSTRISKFDNSYPQENTRRLWTLRLDWQLSAGHRLFLRTSKNDYDRKNIDFGGSTLWSGGDNWPSRNNDMSVGETWVISDKAVHEFRIGYMRDVDKIRSNVEMPRYSFPSLTIGSPTNSPQHWGEFNLEVKNSLSYFIPSWHGQHAIKTGFQFLRVHYYGSLPDKALGSFSFDRDPPSWDCIDPDGRLLCTTGFPAPTRYTTQLGDFSYVVNNPVIGGFFQDNWTVDQKLTLNLGVRYDLELGVKNRALRNPIDPRERPLDANNVAPRLGFAYDLSGNGRTVVRGGWGVYFDKVMGNISGNEVRLANKKSLNITLTSPSLNDPLQGRGYEDFYNLPTSGTIIAYDYKTPQVRQVSIGVAQQLGPVYAFQVDYVHTKGRNEPRARDINLFKSTDIPALAAYNLPVVLPANPNRYGRPNPNWAVITQYETTAGSEYDGLQVGVTKRMSHRFQFQGTYTLSWTYNDHEGNRFAGVNNSFNLADEWSYALADQRHRLVSNCVFMLPWDIRLSTIVFLGSPRAANPTSSYDPFRTGTGRWKFSADFNAAGVYVPSTLTVEEMTVKRNSLRYPKWDAKLDLGLAKTIRFSPRFSLQIVGELYNVTNRSNVGSMGTNITATNYLKAGWSTGDNYQPRQGQLAFRLLF